MQSLLTEQGELPERGRTPLKKLPPSPIPKGRGLGEKLRAKPQMSRGWPAYANLLAAPPKLWQARATTGKLGWEKISSEGGGGTGS